MATEVEKAQALIMVDLTRKSLIQQCEDARAKGISEATLMQVLHLDQGQLQRFLRNG